MKTVYVTWVDDGVIEEDIDVHEFNTDEEYELFSEMHWRGTSTTTADHFEQLSTDDQKMIQAIWEEIDN